MRIRVLIGGLVLLGGAVAAQQVINPRQQPGAMVHIFAPEQHDLYDGHFVISANRMYMVGGLNDPEGWDHLDNEAKNVKPVSGTAEIDVNEIQNTGTFEARLKIPEGDLVLAMDKWHEFSPCQNGGIVAYIHEHGTDSGCGDNNWPKTVGFLAGWGYGHATLNGKPLYQDYEMHFMVTQGLRDRKTLRVNYPLPNKKLPGGETNPATQQIDFYIRSPQQNPKNRPNRQCSCTSSEWKLPGNRAGSVSLRRLRFRRRSRPEVSPARRQRFRRPLHKGRSYSGSICGVALRF